MKLRVRVSAARGFAAAGVLAGALGLTAGGVQATPESPTDRAVASSAPRDRLGNCGAGELGPKRFELKREGGGTHNIDICDSQERGDLSATARALSAAIDAAPPPLKLASDLGTVDILNLRLTRARTEMNPRLDADVRDRKIIEIDNAINKLEDKISKDQ